ncbi:MAG TPA: tRNA lysidine(34) synthetase TilS [Acidobacteriota bacterium]|nr:tRNA lysidine(34) synthetase TilS [Acidobacteriota bacterium]
MSQLESKVFNTIRKYGLLSEGDSVAVAVSGGADSVALLKVLVDLRETLGHEVFAAHVNHQLRGADADADEAFVGELCDAMGVPLEIRQAAGLQSEDGGNLENEARKARYAFLAEIADVRGAAIATAHTLNDQAETFLMKLLRGAGPAGLSGILVQRSHTPGATDEAKEVRVIRPLIEVSRSEIVEYLAHHELQFREDATNAETTYDRNWVRHNLIPLLEGRLNPQLVPVLARSAGLFAEVDAFLQQEAEKVLEVVARRETRDVLIPAEALGRLSPILAKQVIRSSIREVKGDLEGISQQHVDDVMSLLTKTSGRQVHLPDCLSVAREFDWIRFQKREREPRGFRYEIEVPGEIQLKEIGKTVKVRRWTDGADAGLPVLLAPGYRLIVRSRQPGDRYRISPRSPEKSLKKILIERKIPLKRRDRLVICECRGDVVWVEGLSPGLGFKADAFDKNAFTIEVQNETF